MNAMASTYQPNSKLDLTFERVVDVPIELVWRAWTTPEHLMPWFCPLPWKTVECEIDLRPGGIFSTVMRSPEGQDFPNEGCYLEVKDKEKLVWTNALLPGFRPAASSAKKDSTVEFMFTAMIEMKALAQGTRYTATVIHADEAGCKQHAQMGFHEGWGKALEQLVAYAKKMQP
jgi:uncharacterized protein YndB with AHSA1/START domain